MVGAQVFRGQAGPAPQRPLLAGLCTAHFSLYSSPEVHLLPLRGTSLIAHAHLPPFLSLQKACPGAWGSESKRSDL